MNIPTPPAAFRAGLLQKEAAAILGITARTLQNWRLRGFGPQPYEDGGRLLYDRAAVEAFKSGAAR